MRKTLTIVVIGLFMVGCASTPEAPPATTAGYEKILNSWVGATELAIVRKWGPPQQSYETSGRKFLVFIRSQNIAMPGQDPYYMTNRIGNTTYTTPIGGRSPMNLNFHCQTTFELDGEKIVSWGYEGNNCRARE